MRSEHLDSHTGFAQRIPPHIESAEKWENAQFIAVFMCETSVLS
jgi:hypothetical protein